MAAMSSDIVLPQAGVPAVTVPRPCQRCVHGRGPAPAHGGHERQEPGQRAQPGGARGGHRGHGHLRLHPAAQD